MLAAVRDYVADVRGRFPLLRIRHAIYSFEDRRRAFANTAGAHRQERRALHRFATMFGAKDGERSTSFNYTGACAFEPFERLLEAGAVEPLIGDTMRSFDPRPVPGKFTGDVIITPSCAASVAGTLARAFGGYALMGGLTPYADPRGRDGREPRVQPPEPARRPPVPGRLGLRRLRSVDPQRGRDSRRRVRELPDRLLLLAQARPAAERRPPQPRHPARRAQRRCILSARPDAASCSRASPAAIPNHKLDFSGVAKNSFYVEDGEIRYPLIETMVSGNFQDLLMNVRGVSSESVDFGGGAFPYAGRLGGHDFPALNAGERTPGGWPISTVPPAASDSAPEGTAPATPSGHPVRACTSRRATSASDASDRWHPATIPAFSSFGSRRSGAVEPRHFESRNPGVDPHRPTHRLVSPVGHRARLRVARQERK